MARTLAQAHASRGGAVRTVCRLRRHDRGRPRSPGLDAGGSHAVGHPEGGTGRVACLLVAWMQQIWPRLGDCLVQQGFPLRFFCNIRLTGVPSSRILGAESPTSIRIAYSIMRAMQFAPLMLLAGAPAMAAGTADTMAQWQDYAATAVSPRYDWYRPLAQAPTLHSREAANRSGGVLLSLAGLQARFNGLAFTGDQDPFGANFAVGVNDSRYSGRGVAADFNATRLAVSGGSLGEFGLTAVVARQQFATQGFGSGEWDGSFENGRRLAPAGEWHESASGNGVRLDFRGLLGESDWRWDVAVQSRIEMDPFKSYRGVYSEAGDFDVPGFARLGVAVPVGQRFSVGAEVQRVFYREVDPFTSSALPARFLSLLGDGSSPEFSWDDLTVMALEARLADAANGEWSLRFASQQQPRPTSALLDRALEDLYSDTNVALAYQLDTGRVGQFRVAASYSPVTYFLGSSPYLRGGFESGSQLEFEAQWAIPF